MSKLLSKEQIAEIEAREKAATAGPWVNVDTSGWHQPCIFVGRVPDGEEFQPGFNNVIAHLSATVGKLEREIENADFIAHARADVPALLADNRELRARLKSLATVADKVRCAHLMEIGIEYDLDNPMQAAD